MKKILALLLVGVFVVLMYSFDAAQAGKSSKKGLSKDDVQQMSDTVDNLTEKVYGRALFSPSDNEKLISIKTKLDDQMLVSPDPSLAPLYFKVARLYKMREMKDDAIDCFQTILENFSDTALAPKAAAQLKAMGVTVAAPTKKDAGGGEE